MYIEFIMFNSLNSHIINICKWHLIEKCNVIGNELPKIIDIPTDVTSFIYSYNISMLNNDHYGLDNTFRLVINSTTNPQIKVQNDVATVTLTDDEESK